MCIILLTERECNDPESPLELGEVHANGKFFGSKATYSCPDGFKVIGMEERVSLRFKYKERKRGFT